MKPAVVMRPIWFPPDSVNQRLPSGPAVMLEGPAVIPGPLAPVGRGNSLMLPPGVMRPILLALYSVNQRLPSEPAVMPSGLLAAVGTENAVIVPGRDGVPPPPLCIRASVMPPAARITRPASAIWSPLGTDPITRAGAGLPE